MATARGAYSRIALRTKAQPDRSGSRALFSFSSSLSGRDYDAPGAAAVDGDMSVQTGHEEVKSTADHARDRLLWVVRTLPAA